MNGPARSPLVAIGCACLMSCAPGPRFDAGGEGMANAGRITLEQARNAAAVRQTSRSDLVRALGEGSGVRFESGYEVLVYPIEPERRSAKPGRQKGADHDARADEPSHSNAELVVLVAPSGHVVKTRVRLPSKRD